MNRFELLKPGQVFTVNNKVFRVLKCKDREIYPCDLCEARDLCINELKRILPNCGIFFLF